MGVERTERLEFEVEMKEKLFNNLECAIRISPLVAKMRTNHVKIVLNFETSVLRKTRRKKNAFFT